MFNMAAVVWFCVLCVYTVHAPSGYPLLTSYISDSPAGRKDYIRLNARDGESISISNAAIGADTTESLKNAVGTK